MRYALVSLGLFAFCLVGCVSTGSGSKTHDASMEWRMKSLEENFLNFRELQKTQMEAEAAENARLNKRLAALEQRVALADPAMETVTEGPRKAKPDDSGWVSDLKEEQSGWQEVDPSKATPAQPRHKVASSKEPKPWAELPTPKPQPKAPAKKVQKAKPQPVTPKAAYDYALSLYRAERFVDARKAFDTYLKRFPQTDLAANALYWKGETYYSQKNYPQAIMTFKDVAQKYPKHSKVPAAMLKTGMAYEMSGDVDNAAFYLRALVEDYPKSDPAGLARKRLAALGR